MSEAVRRADTSHQHDLFLSYARVDNANAANDQSRGWVSQFHRHLEIALSKKIGRLNAIRIWRDTREIQGNQLFDQTIQDAVHQSALFVALMSNGYLESEYCLQELRWFHEKAQREPHGLAVGDSSRVFNVLLNRLPHQRWPAEVGRTSGFEMNDAPQGPTPVMGEPSDPESSEFRTQLRTLTEAIYETLMKIAGSRKEEPPPPNQDGDFSILVSDSSDTLSMTRKRLLSELKKQAGTTVMASVPPPYDAAGHDQQMIAQVKAASLSVHLLDSLPGREIEDSGITYPWRQAELAIENGGQQLIWVPQSLDLETIENPDYRSFLNRLENGERPPGSYDFIRGNPSSLSSEVLQKVEVLRSRAAIPETRPAAALLDTHLKDQVHALSLGQYLLERQVQPFINPQEDDPRKNLNLFAERLKQSAILIVFFGSVAEEWVRERLGAAFQIAIAEGYPIQACGVYMAPPRKNGQGQRVTLPMVPIEWMDHTQGFNPAAVDKLLTRAQAAGAGR